MKLSSQATDTRETKLINSAKIGVFSGKLFLSPAEHAELRRIFIKIICIITYKIYFSDLLS